MHTNYMIIYKFFITLNVVIVLKVDAHHANRTTQYHNARKSNEENNYFKEFYPPFKTIPKQQQLSYPRDDYITSYDTDYGGAVPNFTSAVYELAEPPLYPNPDILVEKNSLSYLPGQEFPSEMDSYDHGSADADLKDHNLIDSVTYLYGFNNNSRTHWIMLIYMSSGIACSVIVATGLFLCWSVQAKETRKGALYPITVNLLSSLFVAQLLYCIAVIGTSSINRCEVIALLLHYAHLVCSAWFFANTWYLFDHCLYESTPSLKFTYLLAYGAPAVVVLFNYALSLEQYETKHYCWMSIEKGMVCGFMAPNTLLIITNTILVIIALQSVNKKRHEHLVAKIQELVDQEINNWRKDLAENEQQGGDRRDSENSEPRESDERRRKSSSDDCEGSLSDDDYEANQGFHENTDLTKSQVLENEDFYENSAQSNVKSHLHFCLVMQPFHSINWVMGVLALENASHWSTPTVMLLLNCFMYAYMSVQLCTTMPVVAPNTDEQPEAPCEEIVIETSCVPSSRTTDSIPLLDPGIQQPANTPAPADIISTISI